MINVVLDPPRTTDTVAAFNARADAFAGALPTWTEEANDLANTVNTKASEANVSAANAGSYKNAAEAAADSAASSAAAAEAIAATTFWESGKAYGRGDVVWSIAQEGKRYVRWVAGAGTTDPASDSTNWKPVGAVGQVEFVHINADTTGIPGRHYAIATAGITLTMPAEILDGDRIGFTNISSGPIYVHWNSRTVKGIASYPVLMRVDKFQTASLVWSSSSNTYLEFQ